MSDNEKIKMFFFVILMIFMFSFIIHMNIYALNHPEKTERQIMIDLWNGKVVSYFCE